MHQNDPCVMWDLKENNLISALYVEPPLSSINTFNNLMMSWK